MIYIRNLEVWKKYYNKQSENLKLSKFLGIILDLIRIERNEGNYFAIDSIG